MNGLLENGYFKLFGLVAALIAYVWQGATWKADQDGKNNMISYQIAEMDKRLSGTLSDLASRMAKVEGAMEPAAAWRSAMTDAITANRTMLDDLHRRSGK